MVQGDINCGVNLSQHFGAGATVQSMIDVYHRAVNPAVWVYSVNLSGHQQSQLRPGGYHTHLLSGWSEKLLELVWQLENEGEQGPHRMGPALDLLRERYRV